MINKHDLLDVARVVYLPQCHGMHVDVWDSVRNKLRYKINKQVRNVISTVALFLYGKCIEE